MRQIPITCNGQPNRILLASCFGDDDTGGGLFAFDGETLAQVDRLSSTGLSVAGGHLLRLLRSSGVGDSAGELLIYDDRGVLRYYRIDALRDAHDIVWDGQSYVIVSTSTNSILWISPAGEVVHRWKAPGDGDCWHLNSLLIKDGELFITAFGRFRKHREWADRSKYGNGIVASLNTGKDVITGLACPHHPRFVDSSWAVCNSATRELWRVAPTTGAVVQRLQLNGWTRGFAIADDLLFIGESANRSDPASGTTASIAVVGRKTWTLLDRIPLPCREVYDLVLVAPSLLEGVRRGFRTNAHRVAEQDQLALFDQVGVQPARLWATGDPLPPEACRVQIEAVGPTTVEADATFEVDCTVTNLGTAFYVSVPPHPVNLSYKWIDGGTGLPLPGVEGQRTRLPRALAPRHQVRCGVRVQAPPTPGVYILRLTMVQEFVAWFDDLDPTNAFSCVVRVTGS